MKKYKCIILAILIAAPALRAERTQTPIPDFMTPTQLAVWQQERIAKAHATQAAQAIKVAKASTPSAFYTGKPYLAESGTYSYKYREYNPEIARWTTVDPSGFPDGPNNRVYAPVPTRQIDNNGLTTVTVTGTPTSGATGSTFSITVVPPGAYQPNTNVIEGVMAVNWSVSGNVSGWVVQSVVISSNIHYLNGTVYPGPSITYYEAWQVTDGQVNYSGEDDYDTGAYPTNTYGTVQIAGQANFYRNSAVSGDSPSTWSTDSGTPAGILNATTNEPSWLEDSGFNHILTLSWE